jgi:hypothetical protein
VYTSSSGGVKNYFLDMFSTVDAASCTLTKIILLLAGGDRRNQQQQQQQQVDIDTTVAYLRDWKRRNYHD